MPCAADSSASARPSAFAQALSERHQRAVLLSEGRRGQSSGWVRLEPIFSEHNQDKIHYIICNDRATLLYLANLACIDQNPWMSRVGSLDQPGLRADRSRSAGRLPLRPDRRSRAAGEENARFDRAGRLSKTTGGDGMHVYIPLEPIYTYEQVRSFASCCRFSWSIRIPICSPLRALLRAARRRRSISTICKFRAPRPSRPLTFCAPTRVRRSRRRSIGSEVKAGLEPGQFNIHNALDRFARTGDLFEGVLTKPQRLEPALEKVAANSASLAPHPRKMMQHRDQFLQAEMLAERRPSRETRR